MTIRAKILDVRDDEDNKCFLSKISLEDYIRSLPTSYQDYDVQREIVTNVYLDHLVDTVLNRRHIPSIVLVAENNNYDSDSNYLEVDGFKILDGLQRTFRLQAIRKTVEFCCKEIDPNENYLSWSKFKFSRAFSKQLHELNSNTNVLRAVVEYYTKNGKDELLKCFTENTQWFEIWVGLSPEQEVKKMLTLNAGHKPVKTRHQLELLFLNLLPILRDGESQKFQLVREKDISATQFSKSRDTGKFHFAHVITALLSLYSAEPVAPTTSLIQGIQNEELGNDFISELADPNELRFIVSFLVSLDQLMKDQYGNEGSVWMGREVTLAGLFGAFGKLAEEMHLSRSKVMENFIEICQEKPTVLNLIQFEKVRNNLDLSKVNIGNVNRTAVFSAIEEIFYDKSISVVSWKKHFGVEDE